MNRWLDQRPTWVCILMFGVSAGVAGFVGAVLSNRGAYHHKLGSVIMQVCVSAVAAAAGGTYGRLRRLHRLSSQQRYSEPGPMLPYVGLTPPSDTKRDHPQKRAVLQTLVCSALPGPMVTG